MSQARRPPPSQGGISDATTGRAFEVIGKDPARLRRYFGELFGWEFDVPSPVAREVSEPDGYGFLDLVTSEDGPGIRGGVGGGPVYESHAVFYVGVPDGKAALQSAEEPEV